MGKVGRVRRISPPMMDTGHHDSKRLLAPAKLTISLKVLGRRHDGFHDLLAEMVTVNLYDEILVEPGGDYLEIDSKPLVELSGDDLVHNNLIDQALSVVGRKAGICLTKGIPIGGGLGGGSADAAAILRWAGVSDMGVAANLGADVPFCLVGGRALVRGIGEIVEPIEFESRQFVLLVPPFGVRTASVFECWDSINPDRSFADQTILDRVNDLTDAAVMVEPRLARWHEIFKNASNLTPALAGSGSTWFVEGTLESIGLKGVDTLEDGTNIAKLIEVETVDAFGMNAAVAL